MKAYQVLKGEQDKHGLQHWDLIATYLDKQRAIEHTEKIAKETPLYGDILEFSGWFGDGKYCNWNAKGWGTVTISRFEEIEITE